MGRCFQSTPCLKRCFALAIVHFACLTTLAGEAEPQSNEIERFPFQQGQAIYLPVKLFGEKHQFVLDTGCSINLLDVAFVDRLPPSRRTIGASGPGGTSSIRLLQAPEMMIGEKNPRTLLAEKDKFVGIIDFAEVRLATESNCSGIIGMEFLKTQVVRLNLAESFIAFASQPTSQPAHVEKIRTNELKCPSISLQVSGSHLCPMMIDTGSQNGLVIEPKLYERLLQEQRILGRGTTEFVTFDRTITSRVGVLDRASLGPYQVRNIHVAEGKVPLMGLQFLRRFEIDLDFPNGHAYFRP
ncbi:MAG TPA: pepsin/retropepsin-like aspartic protease family protein, partial [Schlesneria sp.]